MTTKFENLIIFIQSITLFFMYKFTLKISKFKTLIDDIVIDLWFYWNFARINYIRRKCNLIVYLSKFISNRKILSEVINLVYD